MFHFIVQGKPSKGFVDSLALFGVSHYFFLRQLLFFGGVGSEFVDI